MKRKQKTGAEHVFLVDKRDTGMSLIYLMGFAAADEGDPWCVVLDGRDDDAKGRWSGGW